jgi:hypothetical protein
VKTQDPRSEIRIPKSETENSTLRNTESLPQVAPGWANPSLKRGIALFALYWMIALLTHAQGLYEPMHNDLSVRLRVARDWRDGLKLYEETYENTQPTYFLFILLVDSSRPEITYYLGETFLAALAALLLYCAMRHSVPRCAMVAPVLLITWTGIGPTFYGGQITEGISIWFDVIALCLFFKAVRRNSYILAFLSGVSFFLMVSIRIPCVLHLIAYAPLLWLAYREQSLRRAMTLGLAFVQGFILGLAMLILHAMCTFYFHPMLRMLSRNFAYASASPVTLSESLHRAGDTVLAIIKANPAFLILMAISIIALIVKPKSARSVEKLGDKGQGSGAKRQGSGGRGQESDAIRDDVSSLIPDSWPLTPRSSLMTYIWLWTALLWLAAALASAFPGGRHFAHYYHVAWPPVSILSVLWLSRAGLFAKDFKFRRRAAWGLAIAFTAMSVVLNVRGFVKEYRREDSPRIAVKSAADYLNQISTPDSIVSVPVWGQWAELWWRAPRLPVSRCFAPQCFYVINREMFDEWVQAMIDRPPDLIVADASLIGPLSRFSPYDNTEFRPPQGHPLYHLRDLVDQNYVEIQRIDDLSFLARRNGPNDPHDK